MEEMNRTLIKWVDERMKRERDKKSDELGAEERNE